MVVVTSAAELLPLGELVDVRFIEFSASLADEEQDDLDADDIEHVLQVQVTVRPGVLEARVRVKARTRFANFSGVAATQFHFSSDVEVPEEVGREFTERVAVMAVYPYLRELVSSMSVRLRQDAISLPLLRSGQLQMNRDEKLDESFSDE